MFNGKQLTALEDEVAILRTNVTRLLQLSIANAERNKQVTPVEDSKKIMELLSKQAKLVAKVEELTKENVDLEKRARPKRKNKKPITKKASFKQVSEEEKAHFLEMYDSGMSTLEMSIEAGRSASCISTWIKKLRPEDFLED